MINEDLKECFETIFNSEKVYDLLEKLKKNENFLKKSLHDQKSLEKLQTRLGHCLMYEIEVLIDHFLDEGQDFTEESIKESYLFKNNKNISK
jgi:hypothetical protein